MTLITALEIANNYPENILIDAAQDLENKKWAGYCYLKREGAIHKIMLSTEASFNRNYEATEYLHDICQQVQKKI